MHDAHAGSYTECFFLFRGAFVVSSSLAGILGGMRMRSPYHRCLSLFGTTISRALAASNCAEDRHSHPTGEIRVAYICSDLLSHRLLFVNVLEILAILLSHSCPTPASVTSSFLSLFS